MPVPGAGPAYYFTHIVEVGHSALFRIFISPLKQMTIESLAIIEDDEKIRDYLTREIQQHLEIERLVAFGDAESALTELTVNPVAVALFDVQLPGMSGIDCIQRLKIIHPRMQMMMLTVYDNADTIFSALKAGASGYMLKSTPPEKIISAIEELYNGGSPISSQVARKVIDTFQVKEKSNDHFQLLTRREQEILEQLSHGYPYKEIADRLFVSIDTVRTHIRNIYEKLHVNSRIEALRKTGMI
jgi:DNA-binding NarL/FixJ family response regulator